jgi:hypothetical protein
MDLNNEIDAVVARLTAGEDPRPILTAFAKAVRGAGRVVVERDVFKCVNCRNPDALCFKCKAVALVGEKGIAAVPMLAAKLGPMVMGWVAERKAEKAEPEPEPRRAAAPPPPPPPPPGQQRF